MNRLRWLARMWHTLRYLQSVQLFGRVWFRLYRPRPDARAAPPMRSAVGLWRPCRRAASLMAPMRLRLLCRSSTRLPTPGDWNHVDWPRLWLYNAHYFDDLVADDASARGDWHRELLARWLRDNPPARGSGWEPYPTSLRIVNWCKWALAGNAFDEAARHSLGVQARLAARRLERHLLGNHLWANAKALVFAGCFFDGAEAARWRARWTRAAAGANCSSRCWPTAGTSSAARCTTRIAARRRTRPGATWRNGSRRCSPDALTSRMAWRRAAHAALAAVDDASAMARSRSSTMLRSASRRIMPRCVAYAASWGLRQAPRRTRVRRFWKPPALRVCSRARRC